MHCSLKTHIIRLKVIQNICTLGYSVKPVKSIFILSAAYEHSCIYSEIKQNYLMEVIKYL